MQIVTIPNPLQPKYKATDLQEYKGKTVETLIREYLENVREHHGCLLSYNQAKESLRVIIGGCIVPSEFWKTTKPQETDQVIITTVMGKDNDSKQMMNLAVMIAVSVWLGPAAAGLFNFGKVTTALIAATITAGTGILLNSLTPSPSVKSPNLTDWSSSSTYSWNPQTTQRQGQPRPKFYGTNKIHGNVIDVYTEIPDGDIDDNNVYYDIGGVPNENVTKQELNLLLSLCEGPVEGIVADTIKINDQNVDNFPDVTIEERYGLITQTATTAFAKTRVEYKPEIRVDSTTPVVWSTPDDDFDSLEIEILFPYGLYRIYPDTGQKGPTGVAFKIEISEKDQDSYSTLVEYDIFGPKGHSGWSGQPPASGLYFLRGEETRPWRASFLNSGTYEGGSPVTITNGKQYDIRITRQAAIYDLSWGGALQRYRTTEDAEDEGFYNQTWLGAVREVMDDSLTYPRTAALAITAVATDRLSGSLNLSCIQQGAIVDVYDGADWDLEWSDNPAWVIYDIFTRPVISGDGSSGDPYTIVRYDGISTSQIDLVKFYELAQFCDTLVDDGKGGTEKRITFNGGFDVASNVWESALRVCETARCQLYWNGSQLSLAIDKPTTSTQMFTISNILKDSFQESFMPQSDLASEIELHYRDRDQDYQRTPFTIFNTALTNLNNRVTLELFGVTRESEAWRAGQFRLAQNQLLKSTVSIDVGIDAIACVLGDVVTIQHDVPDWGAGGRAVSGTTLSLIVDKDLTYTSGAVHEVLVRKVDDTLQTRTTTSKYNPIIGVDTGTDTFTVDGDYTDEYKDGDTITVADSTGNNGTYMINGDSVLASGDTEITVDEEIPSSTADGGLWNNRRIVVSSVFVDADTNPSAVAAEDIWAFGVQNLNAKDYRLIGMRKRSDQIFTLSCIEYNEDIYDPDDETPVIPIVVRSVEDGVQRPASNHLLAPVTQQELSNVVPQQSIAQQSIDYPAPSNLVWTNGIVTSDEVLHLKLNENDEGVSIVNSGSDPASGTLLSNNDSTTSDLSVAGVIDTAIAFSISLETAILLNSAFESTFQDSFSISMWLKPSDGQPSIVNKVFTSADTTGADSAIALELGTDGTLSFGYNSEGNSGNAAKTNAAVFPNGATSWTHIIIVADSTVGGVGGKKIYIDGSEVTLDASDDGSTSGVTFASYTNLVPLAIGARNVDNAIDQHHSGWMDDFRIFNRVLSEVEITALYDLTSEEISWDAVGDDSTGNNPILITYKGVVYEVDVGETSDAFIYWDEDDPNVFATTDAIATATATGNWVMAVNEDGIVSEAFGRKIIHGGLIQANTITAEFGQIGALTVGTLEVIDNAITTLVATESGVGDYLDPSPTTGQGFGLYRVSVWSPEILSTGAPILIEYDGCMDGTLYTANTTQYATIFRSSLSDTKLDISAITLTGTNAVLITTSAAHGLATDDHVWLYDAGGIVELDEAICKITYVNATQFTLQNTRSDWFTPYTSGGKVWKTSLWNLNLFTGIAYGYNLVHVSTTDEVSSSGEIYQYAGTVRNLHASLYGWVYPNSTISAMEVKK